MSGRSNTSGSRVVSLVICALLAIECNASIGIQENFTPSPSSNSNSTEDVIPESYNNLTGGNSLWYGLIKGCKRPSISCVQKNVFHYLQDTFEYPADFKVTEFFTFKKNRLDYKYSREANERAGNDSAEDFEGVSNFSTAGTKENFSGRLLSPFEEVSGALHGKAVKFMMNHDLELKMPDTFFDGATFKVSPRSLEGHGAIVKLEMLPREDGGGTEIEEGSGGRIFMKQIKKFVNEKLIVALLALIIVVKLIKVKLMFLLPLMLGVGAAKKLLLKVLLFLFPPLSLIFKLCHTYETGNFHGTKFHHHHHHISHGGGHGGHGPSHHPIELSHPPPGFDSNHGYGDNEVEYGPPFGGAEYVHRKKFDQDENEIPKWNPPGRRPIRPPPPPIKDGPLTPEQVERLAARAEKESILKNRLQAEQARIHVENIRLQEQLKQSLKLQEQLKYQSVLMAQQNQRINQPQGAQISAGGQPPPPSQQQRPPGTQFVSQGVAGQTQIVIGQRPPVQASLIGQPPPQQRPPQIITSAQTVQQPQQQGSASQVVQVHTAYDPFYSPILAKMDKIFGMLGYKDEPCRERLVCSMYKNPVRFSPHSNLISAELSRDSKELQKPTSNNAAVVRFYRYVQSARDGQDRRDCLRLYPTCSINTEQ